MRIRTRERKTVQTHENLAIFNHLIQREIVYRTLRTPEEEHLQIVATTGD
jgi:hypothetical protein